MQSPFKIFRKHQKVVMAVMVFVALILFGIGDTLMKMVGNTGGPQGSKVVVATNIGKLTQLQMHNLMQQRKIIHRFVQMAYIRSHPPQNRQQEAMLPYMANYASQQFGFGPISEEAILRAWLYRHEARKLGIVVTDKQVEDYIDSFTDRKLSTKKFNEILREMQIGAKELFDMAREELQAVTAFRMKQPVIVSSPEKYWEYYQGLKTRQKIEVVALPVKEFTGQISDPSDAQIAKLFEKHKEDVEQAFEGEFKPGFRQPRRVKLQYLEITFSEIEAQARAAGPVTEKEIDEYYESKKDIDIRLQELDNSLNDDASPIDPGFAPEKDETMPEDEADSEDKPKEEPDKNEPRKDEPGKPGEDAAQSPADESKSKDSPSGEKPEDAKSTDVKPDCTPGVDDDAKDKAPADADKAAKPPAEDATGSGKAAAKEPVQPESPEEKSKDADDKEEGSQEMEEDAAPQGPSLNPGKASPHKVPKIKYKTLDDDLREVIRESIFQERAHKAMKDLVARTRDAMSKVAAGFAVSSEVKLTDPDAKQLEKLQGLAEAELRKIAETFGLKFGQTPLVSDQELSEIPGLGKAQEPGGSDRRFGDSTSIVEQAFTGDALCRVFESEANSDIYLCWKVGDVSMHVPDLREKGVREQVVAAWKRIEALPLARKRAEELAQRARKNDKSFEEALSGETVTGDAQATALTVDESKEFSFWREPAVADPFNRRQLPVQLDDPGVVKNPSRKFMQVVFNELGEGDVGVVLNGDATIYYVVKVTSRHPAEREAFKDVVLFSQNSPYAELAQLDQQFIRMDNDERLMEKYAIKWHNLAGRDAGQMMGDDE